MSDEVLAATLDLLRERPETVAIRTCLGCGLQAFTEADLDLFKIHKRMIYGRENLCKRCFNEYQCKHRPYHKRQLELIKSFKKPILCYFCSKEITKLKGRDANSLDIHSLDGNHENWDPKNKVPSHKSCHSTHHLTGQIGDKHRAWKGDEATNHTKKYIREWSHKRRARVNE